MSESIQGMDLRPSEVSVGPMCENIQGSTISEHLRSHVFSNKNQINTIIEPKLTIIWKSHVSRVLTNCQAVITMPKF